MLTRIKDLKGKLKPYNGLETSTGKLSIYERIILGKQNFKVISSDTFVGEREKRNVLDKVIFLFLISVIYTESVLL